MLLSGAKSPLLQQHPPSCTRAAAPSPAAGPHWRAPTAAPCTASRALQPCSQPSRAAAVLSSQRNSLRASAQTCSATPAAPSTTTESSELFSRGPHWQIHKFGGTCMATAERVRSACQLMIDIDPDARGKLAIVSAMGSHPTSPIKVTDVILQMIAKAERQDARFLLDLALLQDKHVDSARELLGESKELTFFVGRLLDDINNLKAMLNAMSIAGMSTEAFSDYVVGHGELWSAQLMALHCQQLGSDCVFMDTRDVLVVSPTSDGTSVDLVEDASNARLDAWFQKHGHHDLIIATGFIARNLENKVTTLKRNGSDLSATTLGSLFRCGHISIWTDVDGVYSADPRKVPEAVCLPSMTYHEAWELSYFGANVLHPRTTLPAMKYNIPITIRNFFRLSAPGTRVSDVRSDTEMYGGHDPTVKGFATIDNVSLISIEGTGMVGVPGIASTIFSTMRDANINVIMISQASSEQSICFAVKQADGKPAARALSRRFAESINAGRVSKVESVDGCCVLAAVGQGMVNTKGVTATMMSALAKASVNIKAIAQGSSEYNITVLVDQRDSERALRAVHSRFYLSATPLGIGLLGPGLIGGALLEQIREQAVTLRRDFAIDLRVLGIASSKTMLLGERGVDLENWREEMSTQGKPLDMQAFSSALTSSYIPNCVMIDCTASDVPPSSYLDWMQQGIHVITPNKKLGSGPLTQYQDVKREGRNSYTHFFYEGTVGAGLPVIGTLKHLVETGDKVEKVEGVFSGTLSYIFNCFGDGRPFSEVVADAKVNGYTEPDPRDDLNGTDVARKVIILARECGLQLELSDIPIESLVPEALRGLSSSEEYMARLPEFDAEMGRLAQEAEASGEVLRYVGTVDVQNKTGSVGLKRYPKNHAFAQLEGSDNIISFQTVRYKRQPLYIRGPGAGAAVTAGGVFSDLLKLAAYLGAPS